MFIAVAGVGLKFGQEFGAGEDIHSGEGEELFAEVVIMQ